ncbi:MAG: asparaginase [Gammaproteobacteria bacterium]|nr:MAG: asparaginase [Gammaproteobacteria bacterium]UCH41632.1 MAG: asparaginase [Gammaproteobacteria bacterium]
MSNPILVDTLRGDVVENRHRGAIAVCDPAGNQVHCWGDTDTLVYPRSAIKPLQALPLVESGAADHFELSQAELALACSSHSAEPKHTETVHEWLKRIGLDDDALECGAHAPQHDKTAAALIEKHQQPGRIHNNCSGKHTGMLTTARFLGEPTRGYIEREHPAQQRWFDALGDMAGVDMRRLPWSYDGCGIPVIAMPLRSMASAFARVAVPDDLPAERASAVDRITTAIAQNPFMVAGSGRLCTEIMQLTGRRVIVKTGAGGVYTAALREKGLGIALKIDDGTREAAEVALLAVLNHLGALNDDELEALAARRRMPIRNTRDLVTGHRQPAAIWSKN